jgi:uncharacterized membrane protein YgdD (TMEM256/DUF423 family)
VNRYVKPLIPLLSGIFGCAGVALSAAAAHAGGDTHLLASASTMCLAHAPALLALYACFGKLRTAAPAAILLGLGNLLFSGDVITLYFRGSGLFPMAAPIGGFAMMAGWLAIALSTFFRAKTASTV